MVKSFMRLLFLVLIVIIIVYFGININKYQESSSNNTMINDKDTSKAEITEKIAYLTFDDGPSENTKKVLEILKKNNIKATFFIITSLINDEYSDLIHKMSQDGHTIGIHTDSHIYRSIYASKEAYLKDFNSAYDKISLVIDEPPTIYRFPGGSCNCFIGGNKSVIINELEKKGFYHFDWNVSAEDSVGKPTVNSIINNVVKDFDAFDRPVILMHDSATNAYTVEALPTIIKKILDAGYSFAPLDKDVQKHIVTY